MSQRPARLALFLATGFAVSATYALRLRGADAPRSDQRAPYNPQILRIPSNRISLVDAVRITLENDPNLKLSEEDTRNARGIAQTQTGAFDVSLQGQGQWLFTQDALTLTEKTTEETNRTNIQSSITSTQQQVQTYQTEVSELSKLAANPTGYTITVNDFTLTVVQARVDTFNQQIASASSPSQKAQLTIERNTFIAANLATAQGNLSTEQGILASNKQQLADLGAVPKVIQQNNVTINLQLLDPFRSGITLGLIADGSYAANRYKGKPISTELGGLGVQDLYSADVGFSISAALLQGRGTEATGAPEKSALINYQASEFALKHQASVSVLNTVSAYWNLVAAQEILDAATKASALEARRLEITDALIAGDEIPRAERNRAVASRATYESLVASAKRTVDEARLTLAVTMGVAVEGEANAPFAADPFPPGAERDVLNGLKADALTSLAFARRNDRQSSLKLVESGGVLLRQAETNLRPILNFTGQVTANGTAETAFDQLTRGSAWTAPSFQAGLDFQKPIGNNAALGLYLQQQAGLAQAAINARDLDRNIQANIVQVLASLRAAADQVDSARQAVDAYARTIEAETERFKSGETSLLDSIVTQDQKTSALVTYAQARQVYISLLARLRFETGTIVAETPGGSVVHGEELLRLPQPSKGN